MNRTLWLADGKKCIASACRNPAACARRDAVYQSGMWLGDFSTPSGAHVPDCRGPVWSMHIAHSAAVKPAEAKQAKAWIGGRM